jgi:hypothetical protein
MWRFNPKGLVVTFVGAFVLALGFLDPPGISAWIRLGTIIAIGLLSERTNWSEIPKFARRKN